MRQLRRSDIEDALVLSDAAGWNQTAEDWSRLISLEPEHCYSVEEDGRVVATSTLLVHSRDLAWVGMVLTHPNYRKRGHARRLLDIALARARELGIRSVKLDATAEGEPIYRSLGFETEQAIERWRRDPGPIISGDVAENEIPLELDREAFGTDRSRFLRALMWGRMASCAPVVNRRSGRVANPPQVDNLPHKAAYALHRPGRRAWYFGPCVSRTPEPAEQLAVSAVAQHPDEPWFWDILPANEQARDMAVRLGFRPVRTLARMWLGENVRGDDSLVYATAGFEAG
jgi:N-acetylglutamate synthase-like GNAT family acetyltransferase